MSDVKNLGNRSQRVRDMRENVVPDMELQELEKAERVAAVRRLRRLVISLILFAVVALGVFVFFMIRSARSYSNFSVVWENEELGSNTAIYKEMNGQMLRFTMDGVTCVNPNGEVVWNFGYNMRNPRVEVQGEYGVIADVQNESAVIFNMEGVTGTITTTKNILNASISAYGVVSLVLDDVSANYITFYDNSGRELDIQIKTILSGDGYPMDIGLSPSGTGLVSSVVFMDKSQLQNQITFYNFDVGKTESNRVVGYFNCGDIMYPQVCYLSENQVCAFGDSQVDIYSVKNESKPALTTSIPFERTIYSVFTGKDRIGVVTEGEDANRLLQVYDFSGSKQFEYTVDFQYTTAAFTGDHVVLYNSAECAILNRKGKLRYQGTLDSSIRGLMMLDDANCMVMGSASARKLHFR